MVKRRRCSMALLLFAAVATTAVPGATRASAKSAGTKLGASQAASATPPSVRAVPLPRPRPPAAIAHSIPPHAIPPPERATPGAHSLLTASAAPSSPPGQSSFIALAVAPTASTPPADLDAVRRAIALVRAGRQNEATQVQQQIGDPLARKLIEWAILRSDDNNADFARYNAFIAANPSWPNILMLRRRAEAMLWHERLPSATVRGFFAHMKPLTAKGRFALARALLAEGDKAAAQFYVREAWRLDPFSQELENQALALFGELITRADEKARMDRMLYDDEPEAAMRAAHRLGGVEPAIARARAAVNARAGNAKTLLDAVPLAARHDAGYIFSRAQWLRRQDKIAEAGQLMLSAPRDPAQLQDLDAWWIERRLIARKLLDVGDARTAYVIARDAVPPSKENYRVEHQFTAGWIALRFLNDPATAAHHFSRMAQGLSNPIALARAGYWQGRAAEAMGRLPEARAHYQAAARYNTAYYGQLARARLGLKDITLASPPAPSAEKRLALSRLEVVRAAEILYALNERDLIVPLVADLADKTHDQGALLMLAELAAKHNDARAMLLIGKTALGRGFPFDHYAFPVLGLPRYSPIGPEVEPAVVYSIARQESQFNPKTVSSANALGLMQVTPAAGRYVAKKFNIVFDQKRLLHDSVYNVQIGAAEIGDALERYRGSYILAFAAYNAGAGRVKEWIERYGDPRDPRVDPVDWVERIPFSETRNYVQRVLENLQCYRVKFGGGTKLLIEADLRRGTLAN